MQKITVTFIYTKDPTRKLRYRVSGESTIGEMIQKLISFQFVIDCEDYNTFEVSVGESKVSDLSDTFEALEVKDGDEIFITPTVFRPVPPPQNNNNHSPNRRRPQQKSNRPAQKKTEERIASQQKPSEKAPAQADSIRTDATGAPVAFKPQKRGYKHGYNNRRKNSFRPRPQSGAPSANKTE